MVDDMKVRVGDRVVLEGTVVSDTPSTARIQFDGENEWVEPRCVFKRSIKAVLPKPLVPGPALGAITGTSYEVLAVNGEWAWCTRGGDPVPMSIQTKWLTNVDPVGTA